MALNFHKNKVHIKISLRSWYFIQYHSSQQLRIDATEHCIICKENFKKVSPPCDTHLKTGIEKYSRNFFILIKNQTNKPPLRSQTKPLTLENQSFYLSTTLCSPRAMCEENSYRSWLLYPQTLHSKGSRNPWQPMWMVNIT